MSLSWESTALRSLDTELEKLPSPATAPGPSPKAAAMAELT